MAGLVFFWVIVVIVAAVITRALVPVVLTQLSIHHSQVLTANTVLHLAIFSLTVGICYLGFQQMNTIFDTSFAADDSQVVPGSSRVDLSSFSPSTPASTNKNTPTPTPLPPTIPTRTSTPTQIPRPTPTRTPTPRRIFDDNIRLSATAYTDQWADIDTATQKSYTFSGDFEATVYLSFNPTAQVQHAGIGVGPTNDPYTWLRITRTLHPNVDGIYVMKNVDKESGRLSLASYDRSSVYLRIRRDGDRISLAYSRAGRSWQNLETDYYFPLPNQVRVFLVVYSTHNEESISAQFQDLVITEN